VAVHVNIAERYGQVKKTVSWLKGKLREATQSTSGGAFPSLPISADGFGKARREAVPFGWISWLILLESSKKLKQTGPKRDRLGNLILLVGIMGQFEWPFCGPILSGQCMILDFF
jgi:hypothetical protein